jgi:DHA1 family bicyclomycin/chloramphenicol resistance-like MFS transporter
LLPQVARPAAFRTNGPPWKIPACQTIGTAYWFHFLDLYHPPGARHLKPPDQSINPSLSRGEFIPLVALMVSLIALSIDAMLPALPRIGSDLNVESANDQQLVVSALFLGFGVGQIFFGPLSDSIGRKRAIYLGYVAFVIGCILSIFSTNFEMMLVGRVLQGVGGASPRIVSIALVRDQYEGREMARIMSFIMGVFILVPALAPAVGQGIALLLDWRGIFVVFLLLASVSWIWFALRQPETLPKSRRVGFSIAIVWAGVRETCGNRIALGYTLVTGLIFAAFVAYLSSAQQMFSAIYGVTDLFPLYFSVLALTIGLSTFVNALLVVNWGMRLLSSYALGTLTIVSLAYFLFAAFTGGAPDFWINMAYFAIVFFAIGMLFGNLNALAMEPLGHIAGVGAAVVGSISTLISVALGAIVGLMFDGTVLPLVGGFALYGALAVIIMYWTEHGSLTKRTH